MGRPSGRTKEQTRARIVDSALRCFGAHGYGGATNRMIADGAGLTTGALYRHFTTKHDLYTAVFTEVNEKVYHRLSVAVAGTGSLREAVLAVSRVARTLHAENPLMASFLANVNMDMYHYPELVSIRHIPRAPTADSFGPVDPMEQAAPAAPQQHVSCYTEALWSIVVGGAHFAIHSGTPDKFAALMKDVESAVEYSAAQVRKAGTAVAGLDYPVIGALENAAGS
jgi:AcrR family transcriptional regulator